MCDETRASSSDAVPVNVWIRYSMGDAMTRVRPYCLVIVESSYYETVYEDFTCEFDRYYDYPENTYCRQLCFITFDTSQKEEYQQQKLLYAQKCAEENKNPIPDPQQARLIFKLIKGWESVEDQKSRILDKIRVELARLALEIPACLVKLPFDKDDRVLSGF